MAAKYDLPNLLCMFDESLCKLILHIEVGNAGKALMRAKEMRQAVKKLKDHIGYTDEEVAERL